jgi:hypothetical protein
MQPVSVGRILHPRASGWWPTESDQTRLVAPGVSRPSRLTPVPRRWTAAYRDPSIVRARRDSAGGGLHLSPTGTPYVATLLCGWCSGNCPVEHDERPPPGSEGTWWASRCSWLGHRRTRVIRAPRWSHVTVRSRLVRMKCGGRFEHRMCDLDACTTPPGSCGRPLSGYVVRNRFR